MAATLVARVGFPYIVDLVMSIAIGERQALDAVVQSIVGYNRL